MYVHATYFRLALLSLAMGDDRWRGPLFAVYGLDHQRIEPEEWFRIKYESRDWVIGKTIVPGRFGLNPVEVSTVFLFHNHSYTGNSLILYETMIFADRDLGQDLYTERYATRAQALAGHARAVASVRPARVDYARYRRIVRAGRIRARRAQRRGARLQRHAALRERDRLRSGGD